MKKAVKKKANKVMEKLVSMVGYLQPEKQGYIQKQSKKHDTLMRDLVGSDKSFQYEELIEHVCDDLLESVNNQLDLYRKSLMNPEKAIPLKTEVFQS